MALSEERSWIIAYDIADPKRLGRIHRYLKSVALPAQYSVFIAVTSANEIRRIRDRLSALIDPGEDDVRIYLVPKRGTVTVLGRGVLPDGLSLPAIPLDIRSG